MSASVSRASARRSPGARSRRRSSSSPAARWKSPARYRYRARSSRSSATVRLSSGMSRSASSASSAAVSGAPRAGPAGGPLHHLCHVLVLALAAEREMAGDLLGIGDDACESPVRVASPAQRRRGVDGGREERMGELDPPVDTDPDETCLFRRGQRTRIDEAQIGPGQRGRPEERRARPRRQRADPPGDERLQALGDRQPGRAAIVAAVDEPSDLQGVQRVLADARAIRTSVGRGNVRPRCSATILWSEATDRAPSSRRWRFPSRTTSRSPIPRDRRDAETESAEPACRSAAGSQRRSQRSSAGRATGRRRSRARPLDRRPARERVRAARFPPGGARGGGRPRP